MGFASRVDAYTAYQSISQYLSNELCTVDIPRVATDKELLHSTGHGEVSFKMTSGDSKKAKRKQRKQNELK